MAGSLFRTKSIDTLLADARATGEGTLKRTLGPWALIALGIGAIIGAGLFVRTAAAIADRAGPSVVLAFIVAGIGCARGMRTGAGPRAVGDSATSAVVGGIVSIVVLDGIFAIIFYLMGW